MMVEAGALRGDLPDGNHLADEDPVVQPLQEKYSDFQKTQISLISAAIPFPHEGRFAIVTDVGGGMRWTRAVLRDEQRWRGRRSRVVLTPRRRRQIRGHSCGRR